MMFMARPPYVPKDSTPALRPHEAYLTIPLLFFRLWTTKDFLFIMGAVEHKGGRSMAYRILIVDDEAALQNMVKEILTQAG